VVSIRTQRIAEQIRAEVARILREESSDPRIGMLSITRVKVSPDLSHAILFWSPLALEGQAEPEEIEAGLRSATGFVRRLLARNLELRHTPALQFRHDPSIELGSRTIALLRSLEQDREATDPHGDDGENGEEIDGEKA
jgi:ribosome-binding factor A